MLQLRITRGNQVICTGETSAPEDEYSHRSPLLYEIKILIGNIFLMANYPLIIHLLFKLKVCK